MKFTQVNSILANKHEYVSLELEFRISCINRSLYRNTCILLKITSKIRFIRLGNVFTLNYFTLMDLSLVSESLICDSFSCYLISGHYGLVTQLISPTHSFPDNIQYLMPCGVASKSIVSFKQN